MHPTHQSQAAPTKQNADHEPEMIANDKANPKSKTTSLKRSRRNAGAPYSIEQIIGVLSFLFGYLLALMFVNVLPVTVFWIRVLCEVLPFLFHPTHSRSHSTLSLSCPRSPFYHPREQTNPSHPIPTQPNPTQSKSINQSMNIPAGTTKWTGKTSYTFVNRRFCTFVRAVLIV